MSGFDDDIGGMVDDLLVQAGGSFSYFRGTESAPVTLIKSARMPSLIDAGNGTVVEVRSVDFIGRPTEMPYSEPKRGDRIVGGGSTFEVQPTTGDKVFLIVSPQMIRIHTKQVS